MSAGYHHKYIKPVEAEKSIATYQIWNLVTNKELAEAMGGTYFEKYFYFFSTID